MANPQFTFFYAPSWDYPPDGPIKLGNVLASVKTPHRPLFCCPPSPEASDIFATTKTSVTYSKEKLRGGRFSILTKFLSVLGMGVDVGAEIEKRAQESFIFQSVETIQFIPTPSYLQTCVEAGRVRRYLEDARYRKPVYVITGLKIVTGAQANTLVSRAVGGGFSAEVDWTIWSGGTVPVGGGSGVERRLDEESETKWEGSSDFVFAYRVSKVIVGKTAGQVVSEEEYRKGTMLDGHGKEQVKTPGISILGLEEPDAAGEGFDLDMLMEDENVVVCAIPRDEESD